MLGIDIGKILTNVLSELGINAETIQNYINSQVARVNAIIKQHDIRLGSIEKAIDAQSEAIENLAGEIRLLLVKLDPDRVGERGVIDGQIQQGLLTDRLHAEQGTPGIIVPKNVGPPIDLGGQILGLPGETDGESETE